MTLSGSVLRRLREGLGWSQTIAAARYGTSRTHLAHIEAGRKQPSPALARRIAQALDIPLGDLIAEEAS